MATGMGRITLLSVINLVLVLVVGLASGKRKTAVDDAYLVEPEKISDFLHDHLQYRESKSYMQVVAVCKSYVNSNS